MATIIKKDASKAEIKKSIKDAKKPKSKKRLLALSGTLKADTDPVSYQRKLRDEWK